MNERLPWHAEQWRLFQNVLTAGRVPHAFLLRGPRGVGKRCFARCMAQALLCETREEGAVAPCGHCRGCRLNQAGNHPDLLFVAPEEGKIAIAIEQIRDLIAQVGLTAQYGGYKVVLISPAERITVHAANTLLKTLEEPPGDGIFLLVSDYSSLLLPTIRSRCQFMEFPIPAEAPALEWLGVRLPETVDPTACLRAAGGAPLAVEEMLNDGSYTSREAIAGALVALAGHRADPVTVAERWCAIGAAVVLDALMSCVGDLVRLRWAAAPPYLANPDLAGALQPMAQTLDFTRLYWLYDRCAAARRSR